MKPYANAMLVGAVAVVLSLDRGSHMANAAPVNSGGILPTTGGGSTGWEVDWTSPFVTLDWTTNPAWVAGDTTPQGTLQATLDFVSGVSPANPADLVKTIHFKDATPNTVESSFGLRFDMNVKIINDTQDNWSQFAYRINTTDNVPDEGGGPTHPWFAHFHPQATFNSGPFTVQSPRSFGGPWLNPNDYANLTGTVARMGGVANLTGIGVHDYESMTQVRSADLVFVANGSFPILPVDESTYRSFQFAVKPGTSVPGAVRLVEPNGTVSDVLVFSAVPGNNNLFQVDMYSDLSTNDPKDGLSDGGGLVNLPFQKSIPEPGREDGLQSLLYAPTGADPGTALDPNGQPITFQVTSDTPEPSTLALFGLGLVVWVGARSVSKKSRS